MKFVGKNVHDLESIFRAKTSIGIKHNIVVNVPIRFADSGDNTVAAQLPNVKIPANAMLSQVAAVVTQASNLSTHLVNIYFSSASAQAADATISHGTEILGAGFTTTDSSDSYSATDIDLRNDINEVFLWGSGGVLDVGGSDVYIYVFNAGTGNGTTNPTPGQLAINIEYYGVEN